MNGKHKVICLLPSWDVGPYIMIGRVRRALQRVGRTDEMERFTDEVFAVGRSELVRKIAERYVRFGI